MQISRSSFNFTSYKCYDLGTWDAVGTIFGIHLRRRWYISRYFLQDRRFKNVCTEFISYFSWSHFIRDFIKLYFNPQAPVAQKTADELVFRRFQGERVVFFKSDLTDPLRFLKIRFYQVSWLFLNQSRINRFREENPSHLPNPYDDDYWDYEDLGVNFEAIPEIETEFVKDEGNTTEGKF